MAAQSARKADRRPTASCPSEERLEGYFAGICPTNEAEPIRLHVESCQACSGWLAEAGADEEILGDVRQALQSDPTPAKRGSSDFRSDTAPAGVAHDPASLERGPAVQGYRIVGKLGEGGMGVVFEAHQERPRRTVALKVVRAGRQLSGTHLRLFEREADALARLKHPCIASIYNVGRTDDGDPFFAMELVRGAPLGEYVRTANLALPARLALFRQIADAIHYAHQRGVLHRDLKPSNVLVMDEGLRATPKILDFGLARITEDELSESVSLSDPGRIQGTLAYMSPEQARGNSGDIDARSDVYALGVILYELVTGQLPYQVSRRALHEAVRTICDEPPRRPSQINRGLRGDLDSILLRALEKDPQRRYASAAALSEDVQRFLNHQPVLARRPTAAYQLWKLVRRHRIGAAFAGVLTLTVVGFSVGMTLLYMQSNELRTAAEKSATAARQEARKAGEVSRFLEKTLESANPAKSPGRDVTIRDALADAVATLDRGELSSEPDVEAALRTTIGRTYQALSGFSDAKLQFEQALRLHRTGFGEQSHETAASLEDLTECLCMMGEIDEAERCIRQALDIRSALVGPNDPAILASRVRLAQVIRERGQYDEAETLMRDALAGFRASYGGDHRDISACLHDLGSLVALRSRFAEAESLLREALAMQRRMLGPIHPDIAVTLQAIGHALQGAARWDDAAEIEKEELEVARQLYHGPHVTTATSLNNLGTLAFARGDFPTAERYLREALDMNIALFGEKHATTLRAMNNLGDALREQAQWEEAEGYQRRALELRRELLGDQHADVGSSLNSLAQTNRARGNAAAAEDLYRQAYEVRRVALGERAKETLESLSNLGGTLKYRKEFKEAEPVLREALDGQRETLGNDHTQVALTLAHLAEALMALQRLDEAGSVIDECLEIRRKRFGDDHPTLADTLILRARLLSLRGDWTGGVPMLEQALEIRRKSGAQPAIGMACNNLGYFHRQLKHYDVARAYFEEALNIYRGSYGEKHPEIGSTLFNLAEMFREQGDTDAAEANFRQAYEMWRDTRGPQDRMTADAIRKLIGIYEAREDAEKAAEYQALLPRSP